MLAAAPPAHSFVWCGVLTRQLWVVGGGRWARQLAQLVLD
eukprot:SAG25_NODE_13366_length_268_cov_0.609467_1_plen_39_part_10